jgi:hypothetical protein
MIKSRIIFVASAVFLSAALATNLSLDEPDTEPAIKVKATEVLTWDCELPEYKPEAITLTCASGGLYIDKIQWDTWSQKGATGTAIFYQNLCEPSCAEGKQVSEEVNIKLSDLTPRKGKFYLRTLDIETVTGKDFTWGRAGTYQWDVMEFIERMNWDE